MHDVRSTILDPLTPSERDRLLDRAVLRRLSRGDALALAGAPPERVHLLTDGVLKLVGRDAQGSETILGLCLPGEIAGVVAALDARPHPYDYVAATAVTALGIDAGLFEEVVGRNPEACLALTKLLAGRVRWLCDATLERTSAGVPSRLAGRLLDLAEMLGHHHGAAIDLELPFPQRDLGGLAGMCRESACKTLSRWKADGTVDYSGRRLRILRPDVLSRIRCAGRAGAPSP